MKALREISSWVMYAGLAVCMVSGAQWPRPAWGGVAGGLAVIGVGVALRRKAGAPSMEEVIQGDSLKPQRAGSLADALVATREGLEGLQEKAAGGADLETIKKRVEELVWLGPERVGAAQEAIAAKIGFAAYAEVMAPLAASERWMNRAWSAAVDGHRPETVASIEAALHFAREAEQIGQQRFAPLG